MSIKSFKNVAGRFGEIKIPAARKIKIVRTFRLFSPIKKSDGRTGTEHFVAEEYLAN